MIINNILLKRCSSIDFINIPFSLFRHCTVYQISSGLPYTYTMHQEDTSIDTKLTFRQNSMHGSDKPFYAYVI